MERKKKNCQPVLSGQLTIPKGVGVGPLSHHKTSTFITRIRCCGIRPLMIALNPIAMQWNLDLADLFSLHQKQNFCTLA